jgi:putative hydrolase of the HAD superfamily
VTSPDIRAVVFDFGGVIHHMRGDVARALEVEHALPSGAISQTLYGSDAWRELECGRGDREAWRRAAHAALEARAGRPLPPLHDRWRGAQHVIADNVALVRALRPLVRVSILSNADSTLRERLGAELGILDLFHDVVCSAEVGCAKPQARIYALACERLALPPAACVFVDDHEPNVRAAEAAGMRGVLFRADEGDDLRAQLGAAGVPVPAR